MKDATLVQHMTATLKQLLEALLTNLEAKVINAAVTLVHLCKYQLCFTSSPEHMNCCWLHRRSLLHTSP